MLMRGYIDESYDDKVFSWCCILSTRSQWMGLEKAWKRCIASENRRLKKLGRPQISRYHASDCSSLHGEFEGWSTEEQVSLVKQLFAILKNYSTYTVAWDVKLADILAVYPDARRDPLDACYSLLTKFMLQVTGRDFEGSKVTLFHDRTNGYDETILRAFNQMLRDPNFPYRASFSTIAPLSWEDCIALQPADLVAYEIFKRGSGRKRKSFEKLINLQSFGIRYKTLPLDILLKIKQDTEMRGRSVKPLAE